jgi:tripartite-type tricarboxylate transporter receptor subunit TctC
MTIARAHRFAALLVFLFAAAAHAQSTAYPSKPIRLLVPFTPGGGTDIVARTIAQKMTDALGQSVIVDNRPGAGGSVGTEMAVRANPDGYTLIMVSGSYACNAAVYKLSYDPIGDIQPISMVGQSAFVLTVLPSLPVKTVSDLVAYAKQKPGALNYASTGTGGITHLSTVLFELLSGAKLTHVPYKGTGPALTALLGNQVQMLFGAMPAAIPLVKQNRLRALGVSSEKPSDAMPGVPPIGDTLKGYEAVLWYGVWGPKRLPKEVVNIWNKGIAQLLQTKEMQDRMATEGLEPAGGPPEQFVNVIKRDVEKWRRVVKQAKITVQS